MRPYLIINGTNSNDINGLLIQDLPPISKPAMKVKTEEIDGRDGDIVTQLGYKAYDKAFNIGLYGDYDVDEVIRYFTTSGEVIFSNELSKYYNFAVYKAIDFEKLLRFKTAKVTFHVQPFKYDALERLLEFTVSNHKGDRFSILNRGNMYSRPKITITGNGIIRLLINKKQILSLTMNNQTLILDTNDYNVKDINGVLYNRQVKGDLEDIIFDTGYNDLEIRGDISDVKVEFMSRWI